MSRAFLVSLILAEALAVASCISPARDGGAPPIVIGIYSDLSSTGAREGNDVLKGAELRVRDANQARGLGVRTVVLKHLDMRQNPTEAVK